jgi:hypothetical protein
MKLGIMQPYLFPYIGYFQLIASCDLFVIYDDVQYIKGGWINRNRILIKDKPHYITLPIRNDSLHLDINERYFTPDFEKQKTHVLRQIEDAYRKAPFFKNVYDLVRECFQLKDENVASFVTQTIKQCCQYLNITTPFVTSSSLAKDSTLQAEDRVIAINKVLGADVYVNPIGGLELYNRENFANNGIELRFIRTLDLQYPQFSAPFVPALSIIDVMIFNPKEKVLEFLMMRDLV